MKLLKKIFIIIIFSISLAQAICKPNPANIAQELATLDWSAVLPIRIASVPVAGLGRMPDTINTYLSPICVCPFPPPIMIRIGIPVSLYNPSRIIDSVKDPYCYPSVGVYLPMLGNAGAQSPDVNEGEHTFYQTHMIMFAPFEILDLLMDFACIQPPSVLDIIYMTEVDPLWNDDALGGLIQPEAILFGNPISNLACIADSISAQIDYANPALFWCKGSWGNAYPMTGNVTSDDYTQSSASAAAELIYKMHRQLLTWATWGVPALCWKYPLPIWEKDAYRMQLSIPIPWFAMGIGKTGMMWDFGKNPPFIGDDFSYIIFKKRDCCAF